MHFCTNFPSALSTHSPGSTMSSHHSSLTQLTSLPESLPLTTPAHAAHPRRAGQTCPIQNPCHYLHPCNCAHGPNASPSLCMWCLLYENLFHCVMFLNLNKRTVLATAVQSKYMTVITLFFSICHLVTSPFQRQTLFL